MKQIHWSKLECFEKVSKCRISKPLWDTCKSFFSNKYAKGNSNIMLDEGESALIKNDYAAEEFSKSTEKLFSHLDLHEFHSWPMEIKLMKKIL